MNWSRKSKKEIDSDIQDALSQNINYYESEKMGIPASHLDSLEFAPSAQLLEGSTYLQTLINNPNHIGVHTKSNISEPYFQGTQKLEAIVINIISEHILKSEPKSTDGYVSSGGTEGNIQALWVYRNFYNQKHTLNKDFSSIAIICSEDSHYSFDKGADLLGLKIVKVKVDLLSRTILKNDLKLKIKDLKDSGVDKLIVICNMMTTMFGSVDNLDDYMDVIDSFNFEVKVHVDGAYGGFLYPFTEPTQKLNFKDPRISSFTLDAHKMLQAPYGTGIFIIKKGLLDYTLTSSAQYVSGMDCTLVGSRSGSNAIAIYKILFNYGSFDWAEKMAQLVTRANLFAEKLSTLKIRFIHFKGSNIITINAEDIDPSIAYKFGLVPDNHHHPMWYKIVVMDHVKGDKIAMFIDDLIVLENNCL